MSKLSTKTLKIILFIGVFGYLQYYDVKRGAFSFNSITGGLVAASAVYLIASLFGIVLDLTGNYIIAIIGTGALAVFLAYKLDDLIASVSWLTEERMLYILGAFAILLIIRDVVIIKTALSTPSEDTVEPPSAPCERNTESSITAPVKSAQQLCKENPDMMMDISKQIEKRTGRKPTYEELIDYVDNKAFRLLSDEEIKQEIQPVIDAIREKSHNSCNSN